mgnify:CR=1 FL=1
MQVVLPPTYLERCYALVRAAGGVCIADEVQTGFGRNGNHFWMFQEHDVVRERETRAPADVMAGWYLLYIALLVCLFFV